MQDLHHDYESTQCQNCRGRHHPPTPAARWRLRSIFEQFDLTPRRRRGAPVCHITNVSGATD